MAFTINWTGGTHPRRFGVRLLLMSGIATLALAATPAWAQGDPPAAQPEGSQGSEDDNTIIVTAQHRVERLIDVPIAEASGKRGGIHNSLTRILIKPSHLIGGYAQLSYAFNYLGPTGNQRDEVTVIRKRSQEVTY